MMQEQGTAERVTAQVIEATRGLIEGLGEVGAAGWPVLVEETARMGWVGVGFGVLMLVGAIPLALVARWCCARSDGGDDFSGPGYALGAVAAGMLAVACLMAASTSLYNGACRVAAPNRSLVAQILESVAR